MRFVVIFDDLPGMLEVRRTRGDEHLAYIAQHASEIRVAGGLRDAQDSPFVGGMWIVDAVSRERVVELIESDPYFAPEHRRYRLMCWNKIQTDPITL